MLDNWVISLETNEKLLNQVPSIGVYLIGKGVVQFFDFLEDQIIGKTVEREFSGQHLIDYTAQSPKVGTASNLELYVQDKVDAIYLRLVWPVSRYSGETYCAVPTLMVFVRPS